MATGCSGIRTATVSSPAVTVVQTAPGFSGSTSVSGPGHSAAISTAAAGGSSPATSAAACSAEATCTISGLSDGRPLAV